MQKIFIVIIFIIVSLFIFKIVIVFAQPTATSNPFQFGIDISGQRGVHLKPLPTIENCVLVKGGLRYADFGTCLLWFFNKVLAVIYTLALFLGVIFLVYAGVEYITKPGEAKATHQRLIWGIAGIVVAIISFSLVKGIEISLSTERAGRIAQAPAGGGGGAPADGNGGGNVLERAKVALAQCAPTITVQECERLQPDAKLAVCPPRITVPECTSRLGTQESARVSVIPTKPVVPKFFAENGRIIRKNNGWFFVFVNRYDIRPNETCKPYVYFYNLNTRRASPNSISIDIPGTTDPLSLEKTDIGIDISVSPGDRITANFWTAGNCQLGQKPLSLSLTVPGKIAQVPIVKLDRSTVAVSPAEISFVAGLEAANPAVQCSLEMSLTNLNLPRTTATGSQNPQSHSLNISVLSQKYELGLPIGSEGGHRIHIAFTPSRKCKTPSNFIASIPQAIVAPGTQPSTPVLPKMIVKNTAIIKDDNAYALIFSEALDTPDKEKSCEVTLRMFNLTNGKTSEYTFYSDNLITLHGRTEVAAPVIDLPIDTKEGHKIVLNFLPSQNCRVPAAISLTVPRFPPAPGIVERPAIFIGGPSIYAKQVIEVELPENLAEAIIGIVDYFVRQAKLYNPTFYLDFRYTTPVVPTKSSYCTFIIRAAGIRVLSASNLSVALPDIEFFSNKVFSFNLPLRVGETTYQATMPISLGSNIYERVKLRAVDLRNCDWNRNNEQGINDVAGWIYSVSIKSQ